MFGVFKRINKLEAEIKSLNGMYYAVSHVLTKMYVGKYAIQKTDPACSFKIYEVRFEKDKILIQGIDDFFLLWHNINEYKIQDENPKNLKKEAIFCETRQKQLEELMFGIKVSDTQIVKHISGRLDELKKEVDSLKPKTEKKK